MPEIPDTYFPEDEEVKRFIIDALHLLNGNLDNDNLASSARADTGQVFDEPVTPSPDGAITRFYTKKKYVLETLRVKASNVYRSRTNDFSETTSNSFTFVTAPAADKVIRVDYVAKS